MAFRFKKMLSQGPGPDGGALFRPFTEDAALSSASDNKDDIFAPIPDVRLEDGMPLPKYLWDSFPRRLIGKPIQEIDPFYYGRQTFLVISENWTIHRFSALKSMWLFSPFNRLRWLTIRILTHNYYRYLMILVILFTFLSTSTFFKSRFATFYFYIFFTIEMLMKIIANGFLLTPLTYLRRAWNWLDFILNLTGWTLEIFVDHFHGVQAFRVFRIIHLFTYSRISFSWMFRSIRQAKDLLIYSGFLFVLFTIVGLLTFQGQFMNLCVLNENNTADDSHHPYEFVEKYYRLENDEFFRCGNASHSGECPANYTCQSGVGINPNYGYTNFDTFGWSALQILRLMTKDFWEDLFEVVHSTIGPTHIGFILTVMVYGGYVLTNFFVAHIAIGVSQMIDVLEGKKPKLLFRTVGVPVDRIMLNNCATSPESNEKTDCDKEHESNNDNDNIANSNDRSATDHAAVNDDQLAANELTQVDGIVIITKPETKIDGVEKADNEKDTDELTEKKPTNPIAGLCSACVNLFCEWNCCPCCIKFQNILSRFVINRYFDLFICVVITINILMMALDHHHMSIELYLVLHHGSYVVSLIYIVEAILKILALSPKHYFKDSWNVFDFFVVLFILVEMALENVAGLSLLRAFRVLRIFRLGRWWPGVGLMVKIVNVKTLELIVFTAVMASFGQSLMGELFIENAHYFPGGDLPRWHYIDYQHSLMSVIRILGGEWIEGLWDCMLVGGWPSIPFVFTVVIFGNLLIFNLFSMMLFSSLQSNNLCETEIDDEQNLIAILGNFFRSVCPSRLCPSKSLAQQEKARSQEELCEISNEATEVKIPEEPTVCDDPLIAQPCLCNMCYTCMPWCSSSSGTSTSAGINSTSLSSKWQVLRNHILVLLNTQYLITAYTVFLFIATLASAFIVTPGPKFILHIICLVIDHIVLVLFVLEIILKIVGYGCKVYFCNGWSAFEFAVTFSHVVALVTQFCFGLRTSPIAFRPLKLLVRLKRTRAVISAIFYRLSVLFDALMACGLVWLLFAIIGVQLFAGNFFHCIETKTGYYVDFEEVPSLQDCNEQNYTWVNHMINFDNVGNAFLALLQVATFKGWIGIIHASTDAHGIDRQPMREVNIYHTWYFVIFMMTGVLCPFVLLVTAFIRKTNDQKRKVGGYLEILMTADQIKTYSVKKDTFFKTQKKSLPQPTWGPRPMIYRMVTNRKFEITIIIFLIFNAIALSVSAYDITERLYLALDYVDFVFVGVFAIELLLRLIAFGPGFFRLPWNIYDFIVIGTPLLLMLLDATIDKHFSSKYMIAIGWFGVLRVVRLIRWIKWIRRIVNNIYVSLPAYNNIGLVFFFLTYAYALVGVVWFHDARLNSGLTDYRNFRFFSPAFLTMIQLITLAGWDGVYAGLLTDQEFDSCCVGLYVISFVLICIVILMETGVVVLLENYHRIHEKYRLGITDQELEDFVATWHCFDPLAGGSIPYCQLYDLMCILPTPLHIADLSPEGVDALAVPRDKEDRVTFAHTLRAILADIDDERKIAKPSAAARGARSSRNQSSSSETENEKRSAADKVKSWCRGCFGGGAKKLEIADDRKADTTQSSELPGL